MSSNLMKTIGSTLKAHAPEILTGIGIGGMVCATGMAISATPAAMEKVRIAKKEKRRKNEEFKKVDYVKSAWKCYIPSALTTVASAGCIIGATKIGKDRYGRLSAAYSISTAALSEYQNKVIETVGKDKENIVKDALAKEHVAKNPVENNEVIVTSKGEMLCMDSISGRYFRSDIEKIRQTVNSLNAEIIATNYASLNDLYDRLGLDRLYPLGEDLGWVALDGSMGLIELHYSSQIASNNEPCIVIEYDTPPRYGYDDLH